MKKIRRWLFGPEFDDLPSRMEDHMAVLEKNTQALVDMTELIRNLIGHLGTPVRVENGQQTLERRAPLG